MTRKSTIDSLFAKKTDGSPGTVVSDKDRVRTGAISAMGTSLRELTEGARAASRLQQQIDSGSAVVDLDPGLLDSSIVSDRLVAEHDPSFDALVASLETSGQQVPILVRPHPDKNGRYQVAYGHRRVRATARLGFLVRAIVKPLSDDELVLAQGKENSERHDLSFIEKALFARRLEDQGFDRSIIVAALSTDKSDVSRYISVARSIPEPLAHAIGPAVKAGRARWIALSALLRSAKTENIVRETLEGDEFRSRDSDGRFGLIFEVLSKSSRKPVVKTRTWSIGKGRKAAVIDLRPNKTVLTIDEMVTPQFGGFIADHLDDLYAQFQSEQRKEG